jgi:hypothetical protein
VDGELANIVNGALRIFEFPRFNVTALAGQVGAAGGDLCADRGAWIVHDFLQNSEIEQSAAG